MLNEKQYANSDKFDARIYLNAKFKVNPQSWFRWIFEHFPKKSDMKVLELGSGTGLFWNVNKEVIPKSWSITLTDYSEGMLDVTRKNLMKNNHDFNFDVVNAEDINYTDHYFDIIIANNMLYHVENRPKAISGIFRVLKESGIFYASTFSNKNMHELHEIFYDFLLSRNKNFKFRDNPFTLDNGMEQLKSFFPFVSISRYDDMLKIYEIEPIINYFLSFNEMYDDFMILTDEDVPFFREYLKKILDDKKTIDVTKDTGIFICKKKA